MNFLFIFKHKKTANQQILNFQNWIVYIKDAGANLNILGIVVIPFD